MITMARMAAQRVAMMENLLQGAIECELPECCAPSATRSIARTYAPDNRPPVGETRISLQI